MATKVFVTNTRKISLHLGKHETLVCGQTTKKQVTKAFDKSLVFSQSIYLTVWSYLGPLGSIWNRKLCKLINRCKLAAGYRFTTARLLYLVFSVNPFGANNLVKIHNVHCHTCVPFSWSSSRTVNHIFQNLFFVCLITLTLLYPILALNGTFPCIFEVPCSFSFDLFAWELFASCTKDDH